MTSHRLCVCVFVCVRGGGRMCLFQEHKGPCQAQEGKDDYLTCADIPGQVGVMNLYIAMSVGGCKN